MSFDRFLDLPPLLKHEIVRKCCPTLYPRLQQTCRLMNELCEKIRKKLGIVTQRRGNYLRIVSYKANVKYEFSIERTEETAIISYPYPDFNGELNGNRVISRSQLFKLMLDILHMSHGVFRPQDIRTILGGYTRRRINGKFLPREACTPLIFANTAEQFLDKTEDALHTKLPDYNLHIPEEKFVQGYKVRTMKF